MINEISHCSYSLSAFANDLSLNDKPHSIYLKWQLQSQTAKLAKISIDGQQPHWECMELSLLNIEALHGFKEGAVYQAQIGERLLNGRRVSAVQYLEHHENISCSLPKELESLTLEVEAMFGNCQRERFMRALQDSGLSDCEVSVSESDDDLFKVQLSLSRGAAFALVYLAPYARWKARVNLCSGAQAYATASQSPSTLTTNFEFAF